MTAVESKDYFSNNAPFELDSYESMLRQIALGVVPQDPREIFRVASMSRRSHVLVRPSLEQFGIPFSPAAEASHRRYFNSEVPTIKNTQPLAPSVDEVPSFPLLDLKELRQLGLKIYDQYGEWLIKMGFSVYAMHQMGQFLNTAAANLR